MFQRYSTLNAISNGRAEVILGRGSSIDSFPLFGYDLADYEELFEEKTTLFAELLNGGPVTWEGTTRASLRNNATYRVRTLLDRRRRQPKSVIRAARLGFSLMLAIIGGSPARFAPFSQLFQQALERFGRAPLPVGVHSPGHVAATDEEGTRGVLAPLPGSHSPSQQDARIRHPDQGHSDMRPGDKWPSMSGRRNGPQKIAANLAALEAVNRFDLKYGMGGLSHQALMINIELYGTQVIPRVRDFCTLQSRGD